MLNKIAAALVCFGFVPAVSAADVDFDKGTDIGKIVEEAVSKDYNYYPYPGYPNAHRVRYTRDCETFSFGPGEYPQSSGIKRLESVEYVEECHYIPDPPPQPPHNPNPPHQPNHPGQPGHPGHGKVISLEKTVDFDLDILDTDVEDTSKSSEAIETTTKGMQCHERPGRTFQRTAQVNIGARKILPWERDTFQVCLEGPHMDMRMLASAYSYSTNQSGEYDVRFDLTPLYKVTTKPDENGLYNAGFSYADGKFTLNIADRWANEYAGEKVMIKVELYKDGFLFFNSFKGDKEFTFDTAGNYQLVFAENELNTSKVVAVTEELTKGPKKYYAKWGFERIGSLSLKEFIKKDSTDKIEVK